MTYWNKKTWNDRWIVETVFKGKRDGFFVEAGAQHGKIGSCTYGLELDLGWTGILVEPVDYLYQKLVKNRPNSVCVNVCLAEEDKTVEFIQYEGTVERPGAIGYSGVPEHWDTNRVVTPETTPHKRLQKSAITLEKLLDDNGAPSIIDYLSLDIERSENAVLSVFPFDKYMFKAISIEGWYGMDGCKQLRSNGYVNVVNSFCEGEHEIYFIHESCLEMTYNV